MAYKEHKMRDKAEVFQLLGETSASIFPLARDIMGEQFEKYFTEQRFYQPTFLAFSLSPKSLNADTYRKRTPYNNPAAVEEILAGAVEADYLKPDGKGGYLVSEKGSAAIKTVHNSFYDHINQVNQFPEDKFKDLTALLKKLVDAVNKADHLNEKISFEISHFGHPEVENGTLAQVDQLLDDLNAFRDDAHIAAWKPVGVSGHTWEALSFVWNGEANTVEKLVERLPFRNYIAEDYAQTLDDLTQRGWIESGPEGYIVTEEGKKIRDDAETDTDTNYFAPWKKLSDDELKQLGDLLTRLKKTNLKLAEQNKEENKAE